MNILKIYFYKKSNKLVIYDPEKVRIYDPERVKDCLKKGDNLQKVKKYVLKKGDEVKRNKVT
jgi:hypothetical protein